MATIPDVWGERLFIGIASSGQGSYTNYTSLIGSLNIARGERKIESENLLNGGRVQKFTPEGDTIVSMKAYPTNVGAASSFAQIFNRTYDTTEPLSTSPTVMRDKMQLVILWTNNPAQATADAAVPTTYQALRYKFANAFITKNTPTEFKPDGNLSYDIEFYCPPLNKSATANITEESSDGTSELAAVAAYTAT